VAKPFGGAGASLATLWALGERRCVWHISRLVGAGGLSDRGVAPGRELAVTTANRRFWYVPFEK
jgi:hypothetical protein